MNRTDDIELRPLLPEEFSDALWVDSTAFGEQHAAEDEPVFRETFDFERSLCAFDHGRLVGTSTSLTLELTVPGGGTLPVGGLTWIAVLPTHRRRGVLRQMVAAQLRDTAGRAEPASALLASEGGIYGRFGYGAATSILSFRIARAHAAFLGPAARPGHIALLRPEEAPSVLPEAYEYQRRGQPGAVSRSAAWWQEYLHDPEHHREGAGPMYHATHETEPGRVDGYVTYRIKEDWPFATPASVLRVVELLAADPSVYAALWDYLLNTDLVETIAFSRGRTDEPLRWLLADPRAFAADGLADYLWLRLLDIPRALAARTYGSGGELILQVEESFPSACAARLGLRTDETGGPVDCAPSLLEPDLSLSVDSLGAAYLGGVTFATLAMAGRVKELRPGAVKQADAMFSLPTSPYCVTMF